MECKITIRNCPQRNLNLWVAGKPKYFYKETYKFLYSLVKAGRKGLSISNTNSGLKYKVRFSKFDREGVLAILTYRTFFGLVSRKKELRFCTYDLVTTLFPHAGRTAGYTMYQEYLEGRTFFMGVV